MGGPWLPPPPDASGDIESKREEGRRSFCVSRSKEGGNRRENCKLLLFPRTSLACFSSLRSPLRGEVGGKKEGPFSLSPHTRNGPRLREGIPLSAGLTAVQFLEGTKKREGLGDKEEEFPSKDCERKEKKECSECGNRKRRRRK